MSLPVCLVLSGRTLQENLENYDRFRAWVDMVEVRADKLAPEEWQKLGTWPLFGVCTNLLTLRRPEDGGDFSGSDQERLQFYQNRLEEAWDWWDLEEQHPLPRSLEEAYRAKGGKILRSFHDFHGPPHDAQQRARNMIEDSDAVKIAVFVKDSSQLWDLFHLSQELRDINHIVIGIGPYGLVTRILGAALGSLWTYATSELGSNSLGQIDPRTLKEVYRVDKWTLTDAVYGVVGNPIHHSKSPLFHNNGFRELGFGATYVPFLADRLADVLSLSDYLNLKGLSVTLPFKEQAAQVAALVEERVRVCKAANTLVHTTKGWVAHNTDTIGFIKPLLRQIGSGNLDGIKVSVIGSGGATRGIVWVLRQYGARVLVLNRTFNKAQILAAELGAEAAPLSADSLERLDAFSDVIVQTTSAGMGTQIDVDPLEFYPWKGSEIAYDIIYAPPRTKFLQRAQEKGCPTINGVAMFVEQAKEQFELFTGHEYPFEDPNF